MSTKLLVLTYLNSSMRLLGKVSSNVFELNNQQISRKQYKAELLPENIRSHTKSYLHLLYPAPSLSSFQMSLYYFKMRELMVQIWSDC